MGKVPQKIALHSFVTGNKPALTYGLLSALGILGVFQLVESVDYATLFACVPYLNESSICFVFWHESSIASTT